MALHAFLSDAAPYQLLVAAVANHVPAHVDAVILHEEARHAGNVVEILRISEASDAQQHQLAAFKVLCHRLLRTAADVFGGQNVLNDCEFTRQRRERLCERAGDIVGDGNYRVELIPYRKLQLLVNQHFAVVRVNPGHLMASSHMVGTEVVGCEEAHGEVILLFRTDMWHTGRHIMPDITEDRRILHSVRHGVVSQELAMCKFGAETPADNA